MDLPLTPTISSMSGHLRIPERTFVALLVGLAAMAVVVRGLVLAGSIGSNDIVFWNEFAVAIRANGLLDTYGHYRAFNHPPLMGYYAAAILAVSEATALPFAVVFKLLPVTADLAAGVLVFRAGRMRGASPGRAAAVACAYLWSPVSILISAHHGNTDALLAALLLAAALCVESGAPLLAGLALGAAFNVKIVAVFAGPALLLFQRDRRSALRFLAGAASGLLPFVPVLLTIEPEFYRNAIAYKSNVDHWGIPFVLLALREIRHLTGAAMGAMDAYVDIGRYAIAVATLVIAALGRSRRWPVSESLAVTFALVLVLAQGFGVQYCIWVLPCLYVTSPRAAHAYSATAGAFLLLTYVHFWDGLFPALTLFNSRYPVGSALFGFGAWLVLAAFVWARVARRDGAVPACVSGRGGAEVAASISPSQR